MDATARTAERIMIMNITELCVNCKQNNSCTMCWKTSKKKCPHFVQKTNADRIRAMSDEELAELIVKHHPMHAWNKQVREIYFGFDDHRKDKPKRAWLEWLKQPAE